VTGQAWPDHPEWIAQFLDRFRDRGEPRRACRGGRLTPRFRSLERFFSLTNAFDSGFGYPAMVSEDATESGCPKCGHTETDVGTISTTGGGLE